MPLYKNILYDITLDEEFRRNKSGFSRAVYWSRDVMSGIGYLLDLCICHLDVKSNNVLIDDYDIALLYDLGYVVEPLTLTEKYGTPYVYRPPDAINTAEGLSLVDGYALDKWTVRILILEMFICHAFLAIKRSKNTGNTKWGSDIYPELHSMLHVDRFKILLNF